MQNVRPGVFFPFYQTFQNQATIYFTNWKWNHAKLIFFQWKHKEKETAYLSSAFRDQQLRILLTEVALVPSMDLSSQVCIFAFEHI